MYIKRQWLRNITYIDPCNRVVQHVHGPWGKRTMEVAIQSQIARTFYKARNPQASISSRDGAETMPMAGDKVRSLGRSPSRAAEGNKLMQAWS